MNVKLLMCGTGWRRQQWQMPQQQLHKYHTASVHLCSFASCCSFCVETKLFYYLCPQPPIECPQAEGEVDDEEMDRPEKHVSSEFFNQKNHVLTIF